MMKILVTGASGFIGSHFIEIYKDAFDEITSLNSKSAPLGDYNKLLISVNNVDVLIHTAFDHSYKHNMLGIRNILKVCKERKVKKLIHISTVSVYSPDVSDILTEASPYSRLNDPYSREKQKIEEEIEKFYDGSFDIIILQPTIVYGVGGSWTNFALKLCKHHSAFLPKGGKGVCNALYINDLSEIIYKCCFINPGLKKFLVSGDEKITWKQFYKGYYQVLMSLNIPTIQARWKDHHNEFHSKKIVDLIFIIWFKTPFGHVFNIFVNFIKRLRSLFVKTLDTNDKLKSFLLSKVVPETFEPLGITRKVHNSHFFVTCEKLFEAVSLRPVTSLDEALELEKQKIKKILREYNS